jgi:hypothetical protein
LQLGGDLPLFIAMVELRPLAADSLTSAERDIDDLWARSKVA